MLYQLSYSRETRDQPKARAVSKSRSKRLSVVAIERILPEGRLCGCRAADLAVGRCGFAPPC